MIIYLVCEILSYMSYVRKLDRTTQFQLLL